MRTEIVVEPVCPSCKRVMYIPYLIERVFMCSDDNCPDKDVKYEIPTIELKKVKEK